MSGVLEQLVAEVAELRRLIVDGNAHVLRELGKELDAIAVEQLADRIAVRILGRDFAEKVAARAADEVREQVEAILSTAVADEKPSCMPPLGELVPVVTPIARVVAPRPGGDTFVAALARAIDTLERDPRPWKAAELKAAVKTSSGTWARVCARLGSHPAVVVAGQKGGRTYTAKKAARR